MNKTNLIVMIYFMVIAVYGIAEILLQLKFSNWKFTKTDKKLLPVLVPFYLSIYLPPAEHLFIKHQLSNSFIIIGFSILLIGIFLRLLSLITLKSNFSLAINPNQSNNLVVNGIYRYIRHPLYLASILMSCAGCIIFSCITIWIFSLTTLIAVIVRIREEEVALTDKYPEYAEYKNKTHKLIPFIY
jgi:protein-S-isoprenylcysteine O-methyltransferase Ste14